MRFPFLLESPFFVSCRFASGERCSQSLNCAALRRVSRCIWLRECWYENCTHHPRTR